MAVTEPSFPGELAWQMDSSTFIRSPTVYALINELLL